MWRLTATKVLRRAYSTLAKDGPQLRDFIAASNAAIPVESPTLPPYLNRLELVGNGRGSKFFFEVFGCQMNTNDAEIVSAVMNEAGFTRTDTFQAADIVFLVTCAIREKAEKKVWQRLDSLSKLKQSTKPHLKVGVLGCMAERLKTKLIEADKLIDVVCGPDAYRDLPRLLGHVEDTGQAGVNVMLSLEETYADITPVRLNRDSVSAFVSVMRGCDNMCSFCIVPFTRGRERSRAIDSVIDEVKKLVDIGVKEVTLLGQNVNSYRDRSLGDQAVSYTSFPQEPSGNLSRGFRTIYRKRDGGLRFADLLDKVSLINPDLRIRYTSPHPKDFPDELLSLIQERPNICHSIHLPAQSGSTAVLERMRRGYSREAYLELTQHIRSYLPSVAFSSDFISGFCGETEEDHQQTLSLLREVEFDMAFMFAYSMRDKTHAHRHYEDDVPSEIKQRRLQEVVTLFHEIAARKNASLLGSLQLVLVEGEAKRNPEEYICGRADSNQKVNFLQRPVPFIDQVVHGSMLDNHSATSTAVPQRGEYTLVKITDSTSFSLKGEAVARTNLSVGIKIARSFRPNAFNPINQPKVMMV